MCVCVLLTLFSSVASLQLAYLRRVLKDEKSYVKRSISSRTLQTNNVKVMKASALEQANGKRQFQRT